MWSSIVHGVGPHAVFDPHQHLVICLAGLITSRAKLVRVLENIPLLGIYKMSVLTTALILTKRAYRAVYRGAKHPYSRHTGKTADSNLHSVLVPALWSDVHAWHKAVGRQVRRCRTRPVPSSENGMVYQTSRPKHWVQGVGSMPTASPAGSSLETVQGLRVLDDLAALDGFERLQHERAVLVVSAT